MVDKEIAEKPKLLKQAYGFGITGWAKLVDFLTPALCLSCQVSVTTGASLCLECWQKLQFIDEPVCDVLGTPFAYDEGTGSVSPAAIADPPAWDKARAAVVFDDASAHLVHLLKYNDRHEAGLAMARMMAGAGRNILAETDVIVPVPLHRKRLWQRRFNQAAYLTQKLSAASSKPWLHDVLVRIESTPSQVGLDAKQRYKNVRRAFEVPLEQRRLIEGKTVLLVDDVRTTGATANACAETLKTAGALQVHVLSFALVLEPARLHIEA
jgi:ComF family protein